MTEAKSPKRPGLGKREVKFILRNFLGILKK